MSENFIGSPVIDNVSADFGVSHEVTEVFNEAAADHVNNIIIPEQSEIEDATDVQEELELVDTAIDKLVEDQEVFAERTPEFKEIENKIENLESDKNELKEKALIEDGKDKKEEETELEKQDERRKKMTLLDRLFRKDRKRSIRV